MSETDTIQTEADALQDILSWSKTRPVWQRDALRRLVLQGKLTDADIEALIAICCDNSFPNQPLSEAHISPQQSSAPTISLKKIRRVQNVNALAENQSLSFIPKGVVIVYGDNGSGKSGYVRVLKRVCRARIKGAEEQILPNIYKNSIGPQSAEIEYWVNHHQVETIEWKDGEGVPPLLSQISVFDSRSANIHVEGKNDLAYTPYPLKLLEKLAAACASVKSNIESQIEVIKSQSPQEIMEPSCSPDTEVGKLIQALGKEKSVEKIEELSQLSDENRERLAELTADFAQDPQIVAQRLGAHQSRLMELHNKSTALAEAVSADNAKIMEDLVKNLETKRSAATLMVQHLSKDFPLDGVGSNAWRELWEAARKYSTSEAYSEQEFPVVEADARCVLCHQELDQDAVKRLKRFEDFVREEIQKNAAVAESSLAEFKGSLLSSKFSAAEYTKEKRFLSQELGDSGLTEAFRQFAVRAAWRLRAILKGNTSMDSGIPALASVGLDTVAAALKSRAEALLAENESEQGKKIRAEFNELNDRQWLFAVKGKVLAEIDRLKSIADLNLALQDVTTNAITSKATALSEILVTERLRTKFAEEINRIGAINLDITLDQTGTRQGVARFKIRLTNKESQKTAEVLSEGEYRCVALAGFMTDLATNDSESSIIFDDPVSSFDHMHREAIAERLAEEGQKRQVIVFTHDLPFLFMLQNACKGEQQTEFALRHVQRREDGPGYCYNEGPEKTRNAKAKVQSIRSHLNNVTAVQYYMNPDGDEWLTSSRGLIDDLRQAWEAAVEDAVSPVLRIFRNKVNTKGFAKLSEITLEDAKIMRKHYGQCSALLHKAPEAMNPKAATPEQIGKEIDALEKWLTELLARQKGVETP